MLLLADATNPLNITLVGTIIALLFLGCIVGILGWMLRLPKENEQRRTATRAVRSVNKLTRILVPVLHCGEATDRIVALSAQMVRARNGSAELLAVIEVPFMLPLDARVEEDEKRANDALDRAETVARQTVANVNKRILKARNAGAAIVHEAERQRADLILMANMPVRVRGNVQQIDPAVDYVMKNAPCEVLVLSQGNLSIRNHDNGAGQDHQANGASPHAAGSFLAPGGDIENNPAAPASLFFSRASGFASQII
jgi:nucleotide-binding universal stress UspA family protein